MSPTATSAPAQKPRPALKRFLTIPSLRCFQERPSPPGYMSLSSMKNTMRLRKALGARARLSIDELIENEYRDRGFLRTVRDQLGASAR